MYLKMPCPKAVNVLSGQKCVKYFAKKYTMPGTPASEVADLEICLNLTKFMKCDPPFFFRIEFAYL
jgi:hypothetical protein